MSNVDISVNFQKIKPKGKMSQEEMLKFVSTFGKNKKISDNWKNQLIDDMAWKIDLQEPSPVKKMFDPKELPFKPEMTRSKSTTATTTKKNSEDQNKKPNKSKKSV